MVNFFRIFKIMFFSFVVAIFDLVHDVEALHGQCKLLTASGNIFSVIGRVMPKKLQIAVSRVSLLFQKRFPHAVSS